MLRTRLSSGALRAQAHASIQLNAAHPVPAIPAQFARTSQRGLASAVLLSSRENWQSRTVKNLKEALVQRGLPQYGNKKALIARLEEYESKSATSTPTTNAYARNTSSAPSARHISSSAIRSAEASNPASEGPVEESTTPTAQVLTDAEVNIQNVAKPEAADPSTVPGVPEKKAQAIDVDEPAYIGAVEIPVYEEKPDQLAIPPFLPDNFEASAEGSMAPPTPEPNANGMPKVISVAADTAENARHSLHETVTNLSSDVTEKAEEAVSEADKASKDFPPLSEVLSSVQIPSVPLGYITSGLKMPSLKGGEEFKQIDRSLNSEERQGAYLLFGIIAGGLLLGGGKKKHDDKEEQEPKEGEKH